MSPELSRREALGIASLSLAGVASGCQTLGVSDPRFEGRFTVDLSDPLVSDPSGLSPDGFYATVISSADEARRRLQWDVATETLRERYRTLNYEDSFLGVFLTYRDMARLDAESDISSSLVDGEELAFSFGASAWPPVRDPTEPEPVYTVLEEWRRNGADAPREAVVELEYGAASDQSTAS